MSAIREDIKKAYTDAVQSGNSTGKVYITDSNFAVKKI